MGLLRDEKKCFIILFLFYLFISAAKIYNFEESISTGYCV